MVEFLRCRVPSASWLVAGWWRSNVPVGSCCTTKIWKKVILQLSKYAVPVRLHTIGRDSTEFLEGLHDGALCMALVHTLQQTHKIANTQGPVFWLLAFWLMAPSISFWLCSLCSLSHPFCYWNHVADEVIGILVTFNHEWVSRLVSGWFVAFWELAFNTSTNPSGLLFPSRVHCQPQTTFW